MDLETIAREGGKYTMGTRIAVKHHDYVRLLNLKSMISWVNIPVYAYWKYGEYSKKYVDCLVLKTYQRYALLSIKLRSGHFIKRCVSYVDIATKKPVVIY